MEVVAGLVFVGLTGLVERGGGSSGYPRLHLVTSGHLCCQVGIFDGRCVQSWCQVGTFGCNVELLVASCV